MICGCFGGPRSIGCTWGLGDAKVPEVCGGTGGLGSTKDIGGKGNQDGVPLLHCCLLTRLFNFNYLCTD